MPAPLHPLLELQRLAGNAAVGALLERGAPLPASLRAEAEARFGHDFGGVRLHTGSRATAAASALGTRAFTVGRDVVFGDGQYSPETVGGRRLLGHELAHVVQQGRGGPPPGARGAALEGGAEQAGQAFAKGSGKVSVSGSSGVGVAADGFVPGSALEIDLGAIKDAQASVEQLEAERVSLHRLASQAGSTSLVGSLRKAWIDRRVARLDQLIAGKRGTGTTAGPTNALEGCAEPKPPANGPEDPLEQEARDCGQSSKDVNRVLEWAGKYNTFAQKVHELKSARDTYRRLTSGQTPLAEKVEIVAGALASLNYPAQLVQRGAQIVQGISGLLEKGDGLKAAKSVGKLLRAVPGSEMFAPLADHTDETAYNAARTVDMASKGDLKNTLRSAWDTHSNWEKVKADVVGILQMKPERGAGGKASSPKAPPPPEAIPSLAGEKTAAKPPAAGAEPPSTGSRLGSGWMGGPLAAGRTLLDAWWQKLAPFFDVFPMGPEPAFAGGPSFGPNMTPAPVKHPAAKPPGHSLYSESKKPPGAAPSSGRAPASSPLRSGAVSPKAVVEPPGKASSGPESKGAPEPPVDVGTLQSAVGEPLPARGGHPDAAAVNNAASRPWGSIPVLTPAREPRNIRKVSTKSPRDLAWNRVPVTVKRPRGRAGSKKRSGGTKPMQVSYAEISRRFVELPPNHELYATPLTTGATKGKKLFRERDTGDIWLFKPAEGEPPGTTRQRGFDTYPANNPHQDLARSAAATSALAEMIGVATPKVRLVVYQGKFGSLQRVELVRSRDGSYKLRRTLDELHPGDTVASAHYLDEPNHPEVTRRSISDMDVLDYLSNNIDRHGSNILVIEPPAPPGGEGAAPGARLLPIDSDFTFHPAFPDRVVQPGTGRAAPREYSRAMKVRLEWLNRHRDLVRKRLGRFLERDQLDAMFERLDQLLRASRGAAQFPKRKKNPKAGDPTP